MDHLEWARKNKKNIAREFIRKIEYKAHEQPAGVFTAGLPGAGKTEFTQELLKNLILEQVMFWSLLTRIHLKKVMFYFGPVIQMITVRD